MKKPVLFIIFNRPDTAQLVFDEIRKAKPSKLYVSADGPRKDKEGEIEKCQNARDIIKQVDWECEVRTLFHEKNLGCKYGPNSAIDWLFENEEDGIILEDDCVPDQSFFEFSEKMLDFYKNDERVMMICGTNYMIDTGDYDCSYFFSNYYPVWGWATWKRAWKYSDIDMKRWYDFKTSKQLEWIFSDKKIVAYYNDMFKLICNGFDGWDVQWWFACIFQHGLSIIPTKNLINNIGLVGTHSNTQSDYFINPGTSSVDCLNLKHPNYVTPDINLNKKLYKKSHAQLDLLGPEVEVTEVELKQVKIESPKLIDDIMAMQSSREWRIALKLQRLFKIFFPINSWRRRILVKFVRLLNMQ